MSFESQKSFPGVWRAKIFLHRILTACFFAQECDICGAQLLKRYIVRTSLSIFQNSNLIVTLYLTTPLFALLHQDQRNILQIAKDVSLRTKKQGDNNVDPRYVEKIKVLSLKRTDFKGDAEMSNSRIELVMSLPPSLPTHRLIEEYLVRGELFPSAQIKDERKKK